MFDVGRAKVAKPGSRAAVKRILACENATRCRVFIACEKNTK